MMLIILLLSLLSTMRAKRLPLISLEARSEEGEDEPTLPTSVDLPRTPSSTDVSEKGICRANSCGPYGECVMLGSIISYCRCDRNHRGKRCMTYIFQFPQFMERKESMPVVEEIILGEGEQDWREVNHEMNDWSLRTQERQAAVVVISENEPVPEPVLTKKKKKSGRIRGQQTEADLVLQKALKQNFGNQRSKKKKGGKKRRMRRGIVTDQTLVTYSDRHRKMVCVNECQTYVSHSSRLCPGNKLAVVLRIEESTVHLSNPLKKVTCCTARVSETCSPLSTPILAVQPRLHS